MLLHFLHEIYSNLFRLTISFDLKKHGRPIVNSHLKIYVVGLIIDLADGEKVIEFLGEGMPVHVEHPIISIFVEPVLHSFLLFRVDHIPFRILIIPCDLRILISPRISHLHQSYLIPILQRSLIDSNLR